MSSRLIPALSALTVLSLLGACKDKGGGTGVKPEACTPALSASSGVPGTTLTVTGLPAGLTAPVGTLTAGSASIPAALRRDSAGVTTLVVPLHPTGSVSGGGATLTITGESTSCRPVNFTIAALPAAPGATKAATEAVQQAVTSVGSAFGLTPAQLKGDTTAVPELLRALQIAQRLLDHPDNPNSVKAMLAGTAPVLGGQAVNPEVLDRLMASTGLGQAMQSYAAALAAELAPEPGDSVLTSLVLPPTGGGARAMASPGAPEKIDNAYALAYWMKRQARAQQRSGAEMQQMLAAMELFAAAVALAPGGQIPGVVAGTSFMALYLTQVAFAGTLPSELKDVTLEAFPQDYPEDMTLTGEWTARVSASSRGLRIGLPTIIEQGVQHLPYAKVLDKLLTNPAARQLIDDMLKKVAESITSAVNQIVKVENGFLVAAPRTWGPIDVSTAKHSLRSVSAAGVIELSPTIHRDYKPLAPGQTNLIVTTQPAVFQGQALRKEIPIVVQTIRIVVEPTQAQMRTGAEQLVQYRIAGAQDLRATWSASCGTITSEGGAHATFRAPSTPGTCTVTARHVSKTSRSGSAQIQVVQLVTVNVSPASATLAPGEQQVFNAKVEGTQNTAVTWTATRGSITAQGVYTAPQDTGTVTVTATSVADPAKSGTAQVRVTRNANGYRAVLISRTQMAKQRSVDAAGRVLLGNSIWENGSLTPIAGETSSTHGISSNGYIVGSLPPSNGNTRSYARRGSTTIEYQRCTGFWVNDSGQIAGTAQSHSDSVFVQADSCFGSGGAVTRLPRPPRVGERYLPTGINASGAVLVIYGYGSGIYQSGSVSPLPQGGFVSALAQDINDRGQVVGNAVNSQNQNCPILWDGGAPRVLGRCGSNDRYLTTAINNSGVIAGYRERSDAPYEAQVWTGSAWRDLNTMLVEPISDGLGYVIDIGDGGHILVASQKSDALYLLIPVGNPSLSPTRSAPARLRAGRRGNP